MYKQEISLFDAPPSDFNPAVEVAACYLEHDGKLLFLKRAKGLFEGGKWGTPAGKIEKGETPDVAVVREIFEETGIILKQDNLLFVGTAYMRRPEMDFTFHIYHQEFPIMPDVLLNSEHTAFDWISSDQEVPFMLGGLETLEFFKTLRP